MKNSINLELKTIYEYDEIINLILAAGWNQNTLVEKKDKVIACISLTKEIKMFNTISFDLEGELIEKALNSYKSEIKVRSDPSVQFLLFQLQDQIIEKFWEEVESDLTTQYEYRVDNKFKQIKEDKNE